MKVRLLLLVFLLTTIGSAQELGPQIEVPEGIRYTLPSDEQELADLKTLRSYYANEPAEVPDGVGVIGPFLWSRFAPIDNPDCIPVIVVIPRTEGAIRLQGRGFRGRPAMTLLFDKLLKSPQQELKLRRVSAVELEYYWSIAPFDLEGSIFIVETEENQVLWHFAQGGLLYIEDVSLLGSTLQSALEAAKKLPGAQVELSPLNNFAKALAENGDVPPILKELPTADKPAIVLLTNEKLLKDRVKVPALVKYLGELKEVVSANAEDLVSTRIYLQIDLDRGKEPLLRVGSPTPIPQPALQRLNRELQAVQSPRVLGPVGVLSMELTKP